MKKLIKTKEDYEEALASINELMSAKAGTRQGDELEMLVALVEMYEEKNCPIPPPSPIGAIRFRMDQQGLKPKDLVPYIGSRSKVSEVLGGKRSLSKKMIIALSKGLGISTDVLLQEPDEEKTGVA